MTSREKVLSVYPDAQCDMPPSANSRSAPMNSDHAPTAEEQLPPLEEFGCDWEDHAAARIRCYARDKGYCEGTAADALVTELGQREDQLLAALRGNREKDAKITQLAQLVERMAETSHGYFQRADAAEAKLRAVSDALQERERLLRRLIRCAEQDADLCTLDEHVREIASEAKAELARIRAIVEGK